MVRILPKTDYYIDEICTNTPIRNKKDKEKIDSLYKARTGLIKKKNALVRIRIFFYFALYASIISSLSTTLNKIFPFISGLLQFILTSIGIFGATFCLIAIAVLTYTISNYDADLGVLNSHIISIHVKHDRSDIEGFNQLLKKIK